MRYERGKPAESSLTLFGPFLDGATVRVFVAASETIGRDDVLDCRDMDKDKQIYILRRSQCPPEAVPGAVLTMRYNEAREVFEKVTEEWE